MKNLFAAAALLALPSYATAAEAPQALLDYAMEQSKTWLSDPVVVAAIKSQNERTKGYDEAAIIELDQRWRAEVSSGAHDMIKTTLSNQLSEHLKQHAMASEGIVTEVFVMDAVGLNVGQSSITSDYWQGDEAKFQETYPKGAGVMHVGEIELDESTGTYQTQISISITDPESGEVIGAATLGLSIERFI